MGYTVRHSGHTLTLEIEDVTRAALAYNVLYDMAKHDHGYYANNKLVKLKPGRLTIFDGDGKKLMGSDGQKNVLSEDPEWTNPVQHTMPPYYEICRERTGLIKPIMSETWDKDKAIETYNFLRYGINPEFRLAVFNRSVLCVTDHVGDKIDVPLESDWAKNPITADIGYDTQYADFAEGVAHIVTSDNLSK